MIQSFENRGGPEHTKERIEKLRAKLKARKIDGIIVPRSDQHLNEYLTAHDERLLWLTGFSGSAGLAIILEKEAAIFIDGRYTLQVRSEVDLDIITPYPLTTTPPDKWLGEKVKRNMRIAIDPSLLSVTSYEKHLDEIERQGGKLVALETNPLDQIWQDQPPLPENPVSLHQKKYAGRTSVEKIEQIQNILKQKSVDAAVLTAPESVCWLFNIRGKDVPHTPIMLAHAIIHTRAKPELYVNPQRLNPKALANLSNDIKIIKPTSFNNGLKALGTRFKKVLINPDRTNYAIYQILRTARAEIIRSVDPCALPKAIKNHTEIEGSRAAHLRDGTAICKFLCWLQETSPKTTIDEITAATQLEQFRKETGQLKDISFETISAAGPNGAIVHYRVNELTNRPLKQGQLYLVDSGAQYKDGTTDITRTVAIGKPSEIMRRHYTTVLKAHIALALSRFPDGTRGMDIDPIVRAPLWQTGLDFDHGTGHGVGSFLSVHEGPQNISRRGTVPLKPGMIISNEPGYYKEGSYGIRLENLVLVSEPEQITGGERPMMSFETLTLAPFDRNLIDITLLTGRELKWLNDYHRNVWKTIGKTLKGAEKSWLKTATSTMK